MVTSLVWGGSSRVERRIVERSGAVKQLILGVELPAKRGLWFLVFGLTRINNRTSKTQGQSPKA
jgi:hypothetical protein